MLEQLSQLSEAAKPKSREEQEYDEFRGRDDYDDDDDDDDGEKKPAQPAVKRGRGRPKKAGGAADTQEKYGDASHVQSMLGGFPENAESKKIKKEIDELTKKMKTLSGARLEAAKKKKETLQDKLTKARYKALPGKPGKKHTLKDWIESVEQSLSEAVPSGMKPFAVLDPKNQQAGAGVVTSTNPTVQKMLGQLDPKDVKIVMTQQGTTPPAGTTTPAPAGATGQVPAGTTPVKEKWDTATKVSPEEKGKYSGKSKEELQKAYNALKAKGPHKKGSPEFGRMRELAFAIRAKSGWGKVQEGDIPSTSGVDTQGAGLGVGRSATTLEGKKGKKKMNESMHRHNAARHLGKAHALAKEAYNCKFDDMDEARQYHEGFKEGLDECYGQMEGIGMMDESDMPPATVGGMASQATPVAGPGDSAEMDEGNAFTAALAKTPRGERFSVGGKSFIDRSGYDSSIDEMAFESLDKQLTALLESEEVSEGMTVSISRGQQGSPDSVSISAQDAEAEKLLGFIKQAGLGMFGGEEQSGYNAPEGGEGVQSHGDIQVVDDNDGMMSLIKKITGMSQGQSDEHDHDHSNDYADEEETCNECGMMECECDKSEEMVDEVESYDQEAEEVAEDNAPDSDEAETAADENAEAAEDSSLAAADEEEQVTEWANDAGQSAEEFDEETFTTNEEFMTDTIAGGLNKQKATGQTTVPVIASQLNRQVTRESTISDWKKLAGI